MATYNVGPSGAYATLQACLASGVLISGDTIQLESGYDVDEMAGAGITSPTNITIIGDVSDPSKAVCRWSNPFSVNTTRALDVSPDNWTVKGITFKYTGPDNLNKTAAVSVKTSSSNFLMEDCVLESPTSGIYDFGHTSTIRRVKADGSGGTLTSGRGIFSGGGDGNIIESCLSINWGQHHIGSDRDTIIKNCTVYNNRSDANNGSNVTGIFVDKGVSFVTMVANCVVFMNCTKTSARGISVSNGYLVSILDCITYGTPGGDAQDLIGSPVSVVNVTKSSGVGANAVLVDAPSDDFYPADPGLALHTGNALYDPHGGDLNQQPFNDPPSMGCLEAPAAPAGGGGGAVMNSRAGLLPSPFTLTP